jgi:hypothetical protein
MEWFSFVEQLFQKDYIMASQYIAKLEKTPFCGGDSSAITDGPRHAMVFTIPDEAL